MVTLKKNVTSQGNDYSSSCLLDHPYSKKVNWKRFK